jgi:hypothetical protein
MQYLLFTPEGYGKAEGKKWRFSQAIDDHRRGKQHSPLTVFDDPGVIGVVGVP